MLNWCIFVHQRYNHFCSLSMNGCQSREPRTPVGLTETQTFPAVSTPAMAMERLNSAVTELGFDPPEFGSGIIRLEVSKYVFNSILDCFCLDVSFVCDMHMGLSVGNGANGSLPCGWL